MIGLPVSYPALLVHRPAKKVHPAPLRAPGQTATSPRQARASDDLA